MLAIDLPRARRLALRVVLGQAAVTVIAALCALGVGGERAGVSALLGGGIAVVSSLAMAGLVFGGGAGSAARALGMFYIGEAVKLLIVVVLFVVVLSVLKVAPLAMFATFAATFLVYWIALLSALPGLSGARTTAPRGQVDR